MGRLAGTLSAFSVLLALGTSAGPVSSEWQGVGAPDLERAIELATKGLPERAPRWRCQPGKRFDCSPEGCKESTPTVWVRLDFNAQRYERCDAKGCDGYAVSVTSAGVMTSVTSSDRGLFVFRALNDGSQYVETVFQFVAVLNSFGRCAPVR